MSESEFQTLWDEIQRTEKRLIDQFDKDIGGVQKRLDKIEKEIHALGNGKTGIGVRLDRLENSQKSKKNWASWIIPSVTAVLGAVLGAFFVHYFSLLEK